MGQCLCACLCGLVRGWEHLQVELHGQFSSERLQELHDYAVRVGFQRSVAVILLAPLLCLAVVVVADAIPLEPPERGFVHNYGFWARTFFTTSVYTMSILMQCQIHVRQISLSSREVAGIVLIVSALMLAVAFPISIGVGFPIPFNVSLTSMIWLPLVVFFMWLVRGRFIQENEEVRNELKQFANLSLAQWATTVIYQTFYAAFSQMSASTQTKLVLVLPVLKLLQKNVVDRIMEGKEDFKPDVVIFNVELFHSMFVSCCMQRSTSVFTSFALISVDFIQACISLCDLNGILSIVETLAKENGIRKDQFVAVTLRIMSRGPRANMVTTIIATAHNISPNDSASVPTDNTIQAKWFGAGRVHPFLLKTAPAWIHPTARILPRRSTESTINTLSVSQKELFVQQFLRAMFLAEFLLLTEFVEVMIPVTYCKFYCVNLLSRDSVDVIIEIRSHDCADCLCTLPGVYLVALSNLPNRIYYPYMANVDDEKLRATVQSILLYATMELISFFALSALIRRRLPISGIHHLAFVLETHAVGIQSKLVLWFLFVLQSTLAHLGTNPSCVVVSGTNIVLQLGYHGFYHL